MTRHLRTPPQPWGLVTWLSSSSLLLVVWLAVSQAQMRTSLTPDGTLGTSVTQNGNRYTITGGTRPGNGPNLFHSFDRFSVGTGDTASFTDPTATGIANIISRVTGGQPSNIDGTIHSGIAGANLFLLNPNGVLFGSNARLNVSGSFHVSTADYLRLADGAAFSAHLGEKSTLTVAAPAAFGFLGPTPTPVTVQGSELKVLAGQTISVVGGDITLVGNGEKPTLKAPGGRIQLVSVASPGEVGIDGVASAPDLGMAGFMRLGRIDLSQGAVATVGSGGSRNAGEIEVRSGQLTLSGGSQLDASTQGAGRGGDITVQATEAITLTGLNSRLTTSTSGGGNAGRVVINAPLVSLQDRADIRARAVGNASRGNAGEIEVQVGTLALTGWANISASSEGQGRGGNLTVQATEAVMLTGQRDPNNSTRLSSNAHGVGVGGQIDIRTPLLSLSGGAGIRASADGSGNGGDILVRVGTLTMQDGADIGTSTTSSTTTGSAGNVTVIATEAITLTGSKAITLAGGTNTRIESSTRGSGDGGQIVIKALSLSVTEGARIRAQANPEGGPIVSGNAGDIRVEVGTLTLSGRDNTTEIATSTPDTRTTGRAGGVTVIATEAITLAGSKTQIASSTSGSGDAGRVFVSAPMVSLQEGASIRTGALQEIGDPTPPRGNAGDIIVQAGTLTLTGGASILSSTDGTGQAGNITLNVDSLMARGATLSSSSTGATTSNSNAGTVLIQGPGGSGTFATTVTLTDESVVATAALVADGGNIQVRAHGTLRLRDSRITTAVSSGEGRGGNIVIDPEFVILERSQIVAKAFGGPGGNIRIVAQGFITDAASQVSASSAQNVNGLIDIQAVTTLIGLVAPLPSTFASAAPLLRSPCAARLHEGTVSTLVERGRDGVPATPDGVLPSRLPLAPLDTATPPYDGGRPSAALVRPQEESQHDLRASLSLRGWTASVDALRLLPGDCASR